MSGEEGQGRICEDMCVCECFIDAMMDGRRLYTIC
jgi:hypothetical protein